MIHTDAGYYTPVTPPSGAGSPSYEHIWYLKDHLGNNRVLADGSGNALKIHHYDPFGIQIAVTGGTTSSFPSGATESPYKYGGKEWNITTSTYDFEARLFAPAFHRFTTMDPLTEKYYSISPYAYCSNNPVNRIDLSGMIDKEWLKKGGITFGVGLILTIGGGAAVLSGTAVVPGAYAISTGIPAVGLGFGMLITGLTIDPSPEGRMILENTPTGVLNAIGKASDLAFETENHEIERAADLIDAVIGLGTITQPSSITEVVTNMASLTQAGLAVKNIAELAEHTNTNSNSSNSQTINPNPSGIDWQEDLRQHMQWSPSK